jgi:hypothetical protein
MRTTPLPVFVQILLTLLAGMSPLRSAEVATLLDRYCVKCHDNDEKKGGLSLESLKAFPDAPPEVWAAIHEQVELGQMPPKKSSKPSAQERQILLSWVAESLRAAGHAVHHKQDWPNYGNFLPHEQLFGAKAHPAPATPVRAWRQRPAAYRTGSFGIQPFSLVPSQQISDYSALYSIDESSTEIILRNAQQLVESWTKVELHNGELQAIPGTPAQPNLLPLLHPEREPTVGQFTNALTQIFSFALDRAPTGDELAALRQLYDKIAAAYGRMQAGRAVLTSPFLKPEAVYRLELGAGPLDEHGRRRLSRAEILGALSQTLFENKPPQVIQTARVKGVPELTSREEVAALVRELLEGPRPNARLLVFFDEYFDYKKAVAVFKDVPQGIGVFNVPVLVRETERLIASIVGEDQDVFRKLLTTDRAFIEPRQSNVGSTHRIYNLPADFKVPKGPISLSPEERAGILTQPAWLVAHSTNFDNDPVRRGKWILEHLLGGTVPEVPITVNAMVSRDQTRTLRERLESVRTDTYCWKCHEQMNQLGLPFENYDQFGRFRLRELDGPVNTSGALVTSGPVFDFAEPSLAGSVANPIELIRRLAHSKRTQEVFVRYAFRFFLGRNETLRDAKTLQEASAAYSASGGSMKALVVSLLSSDSFLFRTPDP